MACDFNKVKDTVPIEPLKNLLSRYDVELQVVNIDKEARHKNADPQMLAEATALHQMLEGVSPQILFIMKRMIL